MSFSVFYNIVLKEKFVAVAKKVNNATNKMKSSLEKAGRTAKKFGSSLTSVGKSLTLKMTTPIALLGFTAIKAASSIEDLETSFTGILGSAEKAKNIVGELNEFTAKTPFQLADVAGAARKLLAAQVPVENVKDRLQLLGDISAAANIPLGDMSAIFAKIKNKGKAMTEEILQLSDRGIPIIDTLSKQFGITGEQVFKMAEKGKLSFDVITKALTRMTQKGGFANKAMILRSKTLSGVFSTLKDNLLLTGAAFGQKLLPFIKETATKIIDLTAKIREWIKQNPGLAKVVLILGAILAAVGPLAIGIGVLIKVVSVAAAGFAILSGPVGLIIAGVAALSVGIGFLIANWKTVITWFKKTTVFKVLAFQFEMVGKIIDFVSEKMVSMVNVASKIGGFLKPVGNVVGNIGSAIGNFFGGSEKESVAAKSESKNTFQGNLDIAIKDKGKNVESVRMSKVGSLETGLSTVGR